MFRKISIKLTCLLLITACHHQTVEERPQLMCVQIQDQNGVSETINYEKRLKELQITNFLTSQPYKQVHRIYEKDIEGKSKSIITSYHENGNVKQYLEGMGTVAKGTYREWYANGQLKIEATVVGGPCDLSPQSQEAWLFDGSSTAWNESGEKTAKIFYKMGVLDGESVYYYPSGKIKELIPYSNHAIHGDCRKFYEDGSLFKQECYKKGVLNGSSLSYWPDQTPASFEEYIEGKLITGIYYGIDGDIHSEIQRGNGQKPLYKDGELLKLIQYQKGGPEGWVLTYSESGQISTKYFIKDGKKQGEEIHYYDDSIASDALQPKLSVMWDQDKINGSVKTWYENGKLESQNEYSQNKKNGLSCGWYEDGKLMYVEEYEHNLLIKGTYYKPYQKEITSKVVEGSGTATFYDGLTKTFLRKVNYQNGKPQE